MRRELQTTEIGRGISWAGHGDGDWDGDGVGDDEEADGDEDGEMPPARKIATSVITMSTPPRS